MSRSWTRRQAIQRLAAAALGGTALARKAVADSRAPAAQLHVYIGTYTQDTSSRGIYHARFDPETGALSRPEVDVLTANPSFLAVHPSGKFLYAVAELSQFSGRDEGGVKALAIDEAGDLSLIDEVGSKGTAPCHLAVHPRGKGLIVANYGDGTVSVFSIRDDGTLGEFGVVRRAGQGSGVDAGRQEGPHAHCVRFDPSGEVVLQADLGADKVFALQFDPEEAESQLRLLKVTDTAPGAGPRHLAFHPSGRFVFVNNELNSTVTAYRFARDTGTLDELTTLSTLPPRGHTGNSTAETVVHPSGRFVYVSNRGHDSIAAFGFDPEAATLTALGQTPTGGKTPRNFNIDPSGSWLLAANQSSDTVTVFRIDPETGGLKPAGSPIPVPAPVCIVFRAE